jgi:hypothetical protein
VNNAKLSVPAVDGKVGSNLRILSVSNRQLLEVLSGLILSAICNSGVYIRVFLPQDKPI